MTQTFECAVYLRTREEGGYDYQMLDLRAPSHRLVLSHPPTTNDLLHLLVGGEDGPRFIGARVIERAWLVPSYGSMTWQTGSAPPSVMLDLICEEADGPFRDEAPRPADV